MADDEAVAKWSLKDALIVIPFLASALALTWEVGYFVAIRGSAFGLFSIAEHLTFALEALPIALAMSMTGVLLLVDDRISKYVVVSAQPTLKLERKLQSIRASVGFKTVFYPLSIVGALWFVIWYFALRLDFILIMLGIGALLPYAVVTFVPRQLLLNPMILCGGILVVFIVAAGLGFNSARNQILSGLPLNKIKVGEKGKDTETEISVRIMRTGERGVLYFDPVAQTFGLLPWDHVKRVDWAISPLPRLHQPGNP
jgi:hypothetical protein